MSILFTLLAWGHSVISWIKTLPWYVMALAACGLVIVWQHGAETRKDARIASLSATLDQVKVAQAQAQKAAQVAHDQQEAAYRAKAQDADNAYQTQLAAARDAGRSYVASHLVRMQPSPVAGSGQSAVASSESAAAARSDGPGIPADMVAVSADDFDTCTVNTQRLVAAHDWAVLLDK